MCNEENSVERFLDCVCISLYICAHKGCRHYLVSVAGSITTLLTLVSSVRSCRHFAGKTFYSFGAEHATLCDALKTAIAYCAI